MATKLCTHKENVNQINEIHLSKLPCEKKVFYASDSDNSMSAMIDKQVPVGETLELKKGAQVRIDKHLFTESWKVALIILFVYFKVMLAKNLNLSKGLVNGARGIVTQFDSGIAGTKKNYSTGMNNYGHGLFFPNLIHSCLILFRLSSGQVYVRF